MLMQVDKEAADVQKVQNELMTFDILPEEFGGDTQARDGKYWKKSPPPLTPLLLLSLVFLPSALFYSRFTFFSVEEAVVYPLPLPPSKYNITGKA